MDKKYTFEIPVSWTVCTDLEIKAGSLKEAIEIANASPLPTGGDYLDASFEVGCAEEANESVLEAIKVDQTPLKELPTLIGSLETDEAKDRLKERLTEEG